MVLAADPGPPREHHRVDAAVFIGPFNSEVQRIGLLSYARIFFI
jgi:hypothetical protein